MKGCLVKLYDATLPIEEGMVTFPGDPPFQIKPFFQRHKGDPFDLALMSLGTHLGTHVDPPAHYINPGAPVHHILLKAGALVVEGVNLIEVPPGSYEIFCLPIKIKGADGAPARIILRGN
jgi:kynurenine formamidase